MIPNTKMYAEIVSFIRDTFKTPEAFIPLHEPRFTGNERKYVIDAIDSTFVSSVGAYVDRFEEAMAEFTGAKYAVATVNGTAALHISLILAGVKEGDEVLTQPLTFVATTNAISYTGAVPVFIDVNRQTLGMDATKLDIFLTENARLGEDGQTYNKKTGKRLAACVPMHTFGFCCDIQKISAVCQKWNIPLVEDAAESLGSYVGEIHTGRTGILASFSFNGNKTITCGGGGVIITDDALLAARAKHITTTAKIPHKWEYVHDEVGYNYRMPNLNAAMVCAQLEQLKGFLANKRQLAILYREFFKERGIEFVFEQQGTTANYWLNTLVFETEKERDEFLAFTNNNKVMTRPAWSLMNKLKMYEHCQVGDLENALWLEQRIVNIPSSVRI